MSFSSFSSPCPPPMPPFYNPCPNLGMEQAEPRCCPIREGYSPSLPRVSLSWAKLPPMECHPKSLVSARHDLLMRLLRDVLRLPMAWGWRVLSPRSLLLSPEVTLHILLPSPGQAHNKKANN